MSKRRRTSSIASRQEEDSLDSIEAVSIVGPTRKRRKNLDPMELCQHLYETIRSFKKEDGTLLCDAFIRVPKRRQEPAYYEVVSNPIDLLKVQQKLKTEEYEDIEDMQSDIELIISNSKAFYKKSSQEYRDACDLWELFLVHKSKLLDIKDFEDETKGKSTYKVSKYSRKSAIGDLSSRQEADHSEDTSETSTNPDDDNPYEELFTAVMTASDIDNRVLHTAFQVLPSKKKYPEYFEVIESPIDLRTIAIKIQNNEYNNLSEMEQDLLLMVKNACLFNEPGSQIYRDAKTFKKIISSKKIEIEHGKFSGTKSSERIRNKRLRLPTTLSAVTAALNEEESDIEEPEEPMEEEEDLVDSENPQWQLFQSVQSVTNSSGTPLNEPFWRLPSRRFYPDYYREIKNPVSLTQIRRKLLKSSYGTVSEVAGDLNVMFENAKKYNLPTSKLYKDAVKLQKVMQLKVQELLDIDQDTDSDLDSETPRKKPGRVGRPPKDSVPLKRRLHAVAKILLDYTCEDGRKPILGFMEKPSKKLYPDYYDVIQDPIDFLEIESKIRGEQYSNDNDCITDFKLMFANCRQYNEENSPIYDDANILEKLLCDKLGQVMQVVEKEKRSRVVRPKKILTPTEKNCKTLFEAVRDYKEPKANRQLSAIFMKLPSKSDYPDYYEVIKDPIDLEKISQKAKTNSYETLDELVNDLVLMLENACKYNEPDSQIYKDALMLQHFCIQTKRQLKEDDDTIPDVPTAIQDILLNLFTTVYNHQDIDERCYSDSMAELPEHDEINGKKVRGLSFDLIKRRLDKGLYKRLDTFQEDLFACLERARHLSLFDSQIFKDSVELQKYYIKQRDELCKNGELLQSPALSFTIEHLFTAVETARQDKEHEAFDDENETRSSEDSFLRDTSSNSGESMTVNQQTFKVGEFVYLDSKEKGVDPHILLIERLWTNNDGQKMLYGNYYLRPAETFHLTTKKFLEKEVFKSDTHIALPLEEVLDRCCVMNIKYYFTMRPEDYDEKDIYVCESRYSTRCRSFKKIKIFPETPDLKFVQREAPLEPKRVMSVFRERVEKHKDELAELQEQENIVEKEKPNVVAFASMEIDDGNTYYEQFNTICSGVVKTGDFVYVLADGGRQTIAQIDIIWETKDGKCYFRGPWFVTPPEIPRSPNRMFYKQELFLSSLEDTNPIVSVVGKCCVLDYNDYISSRITEIPESDVYICCSMYDEINQQVRKLLVDGLKKYAHSSAVTEDEIYYFPKLINPLKEPLPLVTKMEVEVLMEDSLDGGPPSVDSVDIPTTITSAPSSTPAIPAATKKKSNKNKAVTGYHLYSRQVRKQVVQNHPETSFGGISRLVSNEWRSLSSTEKQAWEEKASKLNEEAKALVVSEERASASPAPVIGEPVYECLWDGCDFQFEEISDCIEHCIKDKESPGHVSSHYQGIVNPEINCLWKNCNRNNKKNIQPFPNSARLVRHVRDMHINKGNGRVIPVSERSKNFKPSSKPAAVARSASSATPNAFTATPSVTVQKPQEPMFITVPPRPQRVLHSEAYIKYIEGLHNENRFTTQWERTLNATRENTTAPPDTEKLNSVSTWLGKKYNQQDDVINALWELRNQLLRDSLGLYRMYNN